MKPSLASWGSLIITHLLIQRGLVALDREHVVSPLLDDLGGDLALAAHGIDGHEQAFDVQGFQQFQDGRDLIALARHLLVAEHQPELGRERADRIYRRRITISRTAQRLAVLEAVGVREHGAHRDHQHLPEIVTTGAIARLARIFKLTESLHQADSRSTHFRRSKDESGRVFERVQKMAA